MRGSMILLGALVLPGVAWAGPFQNGSFEAGSYGGGTIGTFGNGSTAITGWTIRTGTANNVQWQATGNGDGLVPSNGTYALDLTGSDDAGYGGVEQIFDTIANHNYAVTFDVGSSSRFTAGGGATVRAFINGSSLFSVTNPDTTSSYSWLTGSGTFTAIGTSTTLGLFGTAGGHFTGLDNVKITDLGVATGAVPEPATWAMMLIGFGAMGGALRRRSTAASRIRFA